MSTARRKTRRANSCCPVKEYDIFLPVADSAKSVEAVDAVKERLRERFGGFTHFPHRNHGEWKYGGRVYHDAVTVLRVLTEQVAQEELAELKEFLEEQLQEKEILVIERNVRVV